MPKIIFKHHRITANLGDRVCSPYDYFPEFGNIGEVMDLALASPPCRAVVFGGGKIMGGLARSLTAEDLNALYRIAWGVSTVQKWPLSFKYRSAFRHMDLIGTRDYADKRFTFAPCVTCMSTLFDARYDEFHDVVFYAHAWKTDLAFLATIANGIPILTNAESDFHRVIAFLASGRTVVSNSYHGVYWALLLGKRVLCLPFSNKFNAFRLSPGYASFKDWRDSLDLATAHPEMLDLCRNATEDFRLKVHDLLNLYP